MTRGLWITVQLDCSQGIFLKDLNNSFSTIIELVTKASIYNQTSVKTSRLHSNFPTKKCTLIKSSQLKKVSLCLPPWSMLRWGRISADRYWIPECVAEHRGLRVMHQLVVELGGDRVHQPVVLNSHYVASVGHDQVTFQLRGNLVVWKVILSKLSTAWWVSLLMLKIQLVEPAQSHR